MSKHGHKHNIEVFWELTVVEDDENDQLPVWTRLDVCFAVAIGTWLLLMAFGVWIYLSGNRQLSSMGVAPCATA